MKSFKDFYNLYSENIRFLKSDPYDYKERRHGLYEFDIPDASTPYTIRVNFVDIPFDQVYINPGYRRDYLKYTNENNIHFNSTSVEFVDTSIDDYFASHLNNMKALSKAGKVMATIIKIMKEYAEKNNIQVLTFAAVRAEKEKWYDKLTAFVGASAGYSYIKVDSNMYELPIVGYILYHNNLREMFDYIHFEKKWVQAPG